MMNSALSLAGAVCLCPIGETGYGMPSDLHAHCIGPEHTHRAACAFCARLPEAELQQRADAFAARQVKGDGEAAGLSASYTVKEALDIFDRPSFSSLHRWLSPHYTMGDLTIDGQKKVMGLAFGFHGIHIDSYRVVK